MNNKHAELLLTFNAVCKHKTLTATAKIIGCSKSLLSRQLKDLEAIAGIRLMHRTTRQITLTAAGNQLFEQTQSLDTNYRNTLNTLSQLNEKPVGTLTISCSPSIASSLLLNAINNFHKEYPQIHIKILVDNNIRKLITEGVDLAIRINNVVDESLVAKFLGTAKAKWYASPKYLNLHGTPNRLNDLKNHFLITSPNILNRCEIDILDEYNLSGMLSIDHSTTALAFAEQGVAITQLPDYLAQHAVYKKTILPILPDVVIVTWPLFIVYPYQNPQPLKLRIFVEHLLKHCMIND